MYLALKNALGKSFILFSGLLNKFSGATAAYSLRNLSNTYGGPIVKVRRDIVQDERDFNSYEVNQIEDWVNGKQETTLPNQVSPSTASYSLRKVNPSYSGDAVRIRREADNVEVNVGFDSDDKVSTSSPITNVAEEFLSNDFNTWATAGAVNITSSSSFTATALGQGVQLSVPTGTKLKVTGAGTVTGAIVQLFDWSTGGNKQTLSGSFSFSTTFTIAGDQQKIYFRASAATSINFTSLTIEVVNDDGGDTTANTLGEFLTEDVAVYSSDYSSGVDSWSFSGGSLSAPESIGGEDNALKVTRSGDGFFFPQKTGVLVDGETYSITIKLYVPSSNTNPNLSFNVREAGGGPTVVTNLSQSDAWETFTVSLTAGAGNQVVQVTSNNVSMTDGDVFYIKDFVATQTSGNTATVHTWYDQSGNSKDATQDTSGSQPKIAEAGNIVTKLGKASIDFTPDVTFLENSSVSITETEVSYFAVWQVAADGSSGIEASNRTLFSMGGDGTFIATPNSANQMSWRRLATTNSFALAFSNLITPNLHSAIGTSSGANYYFNSSSIYSDSLTGSNTARNNLRIGTKFFTENHRMTGYLSELLIYNSDESANRFKIESNINNYYGIYTASNDGFVHTWYDQSGNTNHATQPATGDQPSIVESGNLINGLKFSGDGSTQTDFLKTDLVTTDLGTEFCLGFVGTIESTHSSTARHSVFGNTKQVGAYPNGRVAIAAVPATGSYRFTNENGAETSVIHSPAVGVNTEAIVLANYDDASVKIRVNGSETTGTITSPNLNDSTVTLDIMRAKFNNSVTRQQNSPEGTVREIFVYPSNQSSTLEGIETNINNHYSTF